ncbi:single-stranded-DNA-specific exonuclease RecJ [Vaginisenegalia massiliensis]|uniref:single-stranded-DNA-specific exonuclease RecJ n=1 Tax=Vaginisenegalia massiliensis TaxID=2058294 RepID=UPI000F51E8E3|nr:single-stranded-DNA-specific exonuclease RecJ [Vaginisenegalia massiliensis]
MTFAKYQWTIPSFNQTDFNQLKLACDQAGMTFSPAFLRLCLKRGLANPQAIQSAIDKQPTLFHDPYLLYDMDRAVERLNQAIENQELITIYGDYDADGITSTLILLECLESLGARVNYYLPNRLIDGYGPNLARYQSLVEAGTQVILTCDNGVAGHEAIAWAMEQGVDVIVSDHHELQATLPNALAVIHPRHPLGQYPFGQLSGAGVALKIACALLDEIPLEAVELAMIGTICDLVSLTDENRTIVLNGLSILKQSNRPGLQALFDTHQINQDQINEESIGFLIGPRLNASGRLGDPKPGLNWLRAYDKEDSQKWLQQIETTNQDRQDIVKSIMLDVEEQMAQYEKLPPIIIQSSPKWPAGVLGIVAGKLVELYQRPCLVAQYIETEGVYRGSGRSVSQFNLFASLQEVQDYIKYFGGHAQAAGFTVNQDQWQTFTQALVQVAKREEATILKPKELDLDLVLKIDEINLDLLDEISLLAPFGMDNPRPLVAIESTRVAKLRRIGTDKQHIKFDISDVNVGNLTLPVIGFNIASRFTQIQDTTMIQCVGELKKNIWQDRAQVQLQLLDFEVEEQLWVDYRSSQLNPTLFEENQAVYVFQHQSLREYCQKDFNKTQVSLLFGDWSDAIENNGYSALVVVEPPNDLAELKKILDSQSWSKIILGAYCPESKYLAGVPSRQEFARLYAWLKTSSGFNIRQQLDSLSQHLAIHPIKLKYMLSVFFEAKFVTITHGFAEFNHSDSHEKIDLYQLPAMQLYQTAMKAEEVLIYQDIQQIKEYFERT